MSSLLVPWLLFPLVLLALSYGCGLLLEWAAGMDLPGALVLPCGFAVLTLVAQFAVLTDATAELATPAVVVAAIAGVVLARPWQSFHVDGWAAGAGVGAFAAYAAPIVLSGAAGFGGYVKLDDDSTLVALVDRAMEHGRDISGLEFSTYYRVVDLLLDEGYPLGSLLPMGIGHEITRADSLWLYQPAMGFMAAMLALGLYALAGNIVERAWVRATAAFVGAQAALLYGYALWGGIKELGSAWALPVLAALDTRGGQVHVVAAADAVGGHVRAALRRAQRGGARLGGACPRRLPAAHHPRAGLAGRSAAAGRVRRLPRTLRIADDRRGACLPDIEHRQLRPDCESRRSAQPHPARRHLAGRRFPGRSLPGDGHTAHHCPRRGGGRRRSRVGGAARILGAADVCAWGCGERRRAVGF